MTQLRVITRALLRLHGETQRSRWTEAVQERLGQKDGYGLGFEADAIHVLIVERPVQRAGDQGADLEVDATAAVLEDWPGPTVIGWAWGGLMERVRIAIEPPVETGGVKNPRQDIAFARLGVC